MRDRAFILADAGSNHDGDLEKAKQLIELAAEAGCNGINFHSYVADRMVDPSTPQYETFKRCELSYTDLAYLKAHADKTGIDLVIMPFDAETLSHAIDRLGVRIIKTPQLDILDTAFLGAVNTYGRVLPSLSILLLTGRANGPEIKLAVDHLPDVNDITVMHCVLGQPTDEKNVNLAAMGNLFRLFGGWCDIGYSDYTDEILVPALSVLTGAKTIEKNFALKRVGTSADLDMMSEMVSIIRMHEDILGHGKLEGA